MKSSKELAAAGLAVALLCVSSLLPVQSNRAGALPAEHVVAASAAASAPTPWASIFVGVSVVSVMLDAAIVSQTQCRQLTTREAVTSVLLPLVGIAFNEANNRCRGH